MAEHAPTQSRFITPEEWSPEKKGRALHAIFVLAITPCDEWRTRKEIHEALAEFRVTARTQSEKR